jgi:predicted S18 family serine protease
MYKNHAFSVFAVAALAGVAACSPGNDTVRDETVVTTDTSMFTEQGMETREVEVPVTETGIVETRVETTQEVTVDTTRNMGTTRTMGDTVRRP